MKILERTKFRGKGVSSQNGGAVLVRMERNGAFWKRPEAVECHFRLPGGKNFIPGWGVPGGNAIGWRQSAGLKKGVAPKGGGLEYQGVQTKKTTPPKKTDGKCKGCLGGGGVASFATGPWEKKRNFSWA